MAMVAQTATLVRCERCRAVFSSAQAGDMIRHGCGVCGGTLSLCPGHRPPPPGAPPPSPERRMLVVLREADGRPVGLDALAAAGIDDPARTIYELERAGHRIERAYADVTTGRRRLLGYRLRGAARQVGGSQPSSSR